MTVGRRCCRFRCRSHGTELWGAGALLAAGVWELEAPPPAAGTAGEEAGEAMGEEAMGEEAVGEEGQRRPFAVARRRRPHDAAGSR